MILKQTTFRKLSWPVRLTLVLVAATVLPLSIRTAEAQKPETAARVKAATKGMTVEQRLERVENLVQELVDELRADRKDRAEQSGPVVLTTVPANGDDAVDPNTTEIKVTFNKKMKDGNWSWVTLVKENFPETTGKPRYEEGQKTCVLPVKLEPGKTYTIGINSGRFNSFKDMSGRSATPLVLEFKTKS